MNLTIIGMGVEQGDLSLRALESIRAAETVLVRTEKAEYAKTLKTFGICYRALDEVYEKSRNFNTLAVNLAKEVIASARKSKTVYLVEGSALDDTSVRYLLSKYPKTPVIVGVGKGQTCFARVGLSDGTAFSAYDIAGKGDVGFPLAVYDVDSAYLASEVKLFLMKKAGEETPVYILQGKEVKQIPLYELDWQNHYDYATAVVVPQSEFLSKPRYTYTDLIEIVRLLRAENGCPWDRAQTHESIRMNLIEEAYELAEAIDLKDDVKMQEETGDLLLQAVFHEVLAEERGAFDSDDVTTEICKKLIFRHSHIFGTDKAENSDQALDTWEKNKKKEKHQTTASDAVRDVPKTFPALMRAEKVQKRAAKIGFDFASAMDALQKIKEETEELLSAMQSGEQQKIEEEGGDLLFSVCNVLRLSKVECEQALTRSIEKFIARFTRMESAILTDGKDPQTLTAKQMDEYYNAVKNA